VENQNLKKSPVNTQQSFKNVAPAGLPLQKNTFKGEFSEIL
jgi:hypothetical protein